MQRCDRRARLFVALGERNSSAGVVRPGRRPTGGIDSLQGGDELAQRARRLTWIGQALVRRVLALEPRAHGPVPGVALARRSLRERNGDGEGQQRRERRQPAVFLLRLTGGPVDAGQPHRHAVAEPVDRVVRPGGAHPLERKVRPVRKLRREQAADEGRVGVHLVRVHLLGGQVWICCASDGPAQPLMMLCTWATEGWPGSAPSSPMIGSSVSPKASNDSWESQTSNT